MAQEGGRRPPPTHIRIPGHLPHAFEPPAPLPAVSVPDQTPHRTHLHLRLLVFQKSLHGGGGIPGSHLTEVLNRLGSYGEGLVMEEAAYLLLRLFGPQDREELHGPPADLRRFVPQEPGQVIRKLFRGCSLQERQGIEHLVLVPPAKHPTKLLHNLGAQMLNQQIFQPHVLDSDETAKGAGELTPHPPGGHEPPPDRHHRQDADPTQGQVQSVDEDEKQHPSQSRPPSIDGKIDEGLHLVLHIGGNREEEKLPG